MWRKKLISVPFHCKELIHDILFSNCTFVPYGQPMIIPQLLGIFMLLIMPFLESCFVYLGTLECLIFFDSHSIPSFSVLMRKLVYSMYKQVLTSSNGLVKIHLDSDFF